jgi:hypothetical protein
MAKYEGGQVQMAWDPAGGTAWATLAQLGDLSGPNISRTSIDVTTRDTTPSYWREFIRGYKDGGEVSLQLMFDPALATHGTATGILGDFNQDGTVIPNWKMTFPDNSTCVFKGFVTGSDITSSIDDPLSANVTVKVTGKPVFA